MMPHHDEPMSLKDFLGARAEDLHEFVPETLIWVVEGTRRSAALAGLDVTSDEFPVWSLMRMFECTDILVKHGVQHIVVPYLTPSQFAERTPGYSERIIEWVALLVTHPEISRALLARGWRVRLVGVEHINALHDVATQLAAQTSNAGSTLWLVVTQKTGDQWKALLSAALRAGATSREEAVRALYGETIPPATMLLSFGKPVISMDQLPPLLIGKMDCYWSQKPGYRLTEEDFRTVLYDATHTRKTWRTDKGGRAEQATEYREHWEQGPILGLGVQLGPHWYPTQQQTTSSET